MQKCRYCKRFSFLYKKYQKVGCSEGVYMEFPNHRLRRGHNCFEIYPIRKFRSVRLMKEIKLENLLSSFNFMMNLYYRSQFSHHPPRANFSFLITGRVNVVFPACIN